MPVNDETKWWQAKLNEVGISPDLAVDGDRGPLTEARAATVMSLAAEALTTPPAGDAGDAELGAAARALLDLHREQSP